MDPFVPPRSDAEATVYPEDEYDGPWVKVSQAVLVGVGAIYVLLGVGVGAIYTLVPLMLAAEEPDALVMLPFGILMLLCCAGFGIVNMVAAWGLGGRHKWGWILSLILGAMYLTSACMPFGAVLMYALLVDEPTRKLFLK